jgi:cytochrome c-type biogenesis protein CcmE
VSKQHIKLSIGAAVVVAAMAYLVLSGSTGSTAYFLTVPEVQQRFASLYDEPLRVAGKVTDDPIHWDVQSLSLAFHIGEGVSRLPVRFKGVKPDMFQTGVNVIVEGHLGHDGVLVASNLMTRCPSKYEEEKQPTS